MPDNYKKIIYEASRIVNVEDMSTAEIIHNYYLAELPVVVEYVELAYIQVGEDYYDDTKYSMVTLDPELFIKIKHVDVVDLRK